MIYHNKPRNIVKLKQCIQETIASISASVLERAIAEFERRIKLIIVDDGKHVKV